MVNGQMNGLANDVNAKTFYSLSGVKSYFSSMLLSPHIIQYAHLFIWIRFIQRNTTSNTGHTFSILQFNFQKATANYIEPFDVGFCWWFQNEKLIHNKIIIHLIAEIDLKSKTNSKVLSKANRRVRDNTASNHGHNNHFNYKCKSNTQYLLRPFNGLMDEWKCSIFTRDERSFSLSLEYIGSHQSKNHIIDYCIHPFEFAFGLRQFKFVNFLN